jgi:hypothetical protein
MDEFEELCLLGLILFSDEEDQNKSFRKLLSLSGRRMRSGKIQRASLQPVANSSFYRLFASGKDDALITLCGFDHTTFSSLLALSPTNALKCVFTTRMMTRTRGDDDNNNKDQVANNKGLKKYFRATLALYGIHDSKFI